MSDLRQQVLAASLALIEERGLSALSMREVARRAGVSHQAPYHYFGRKEAIVAALVAEGYGRLHTMLSGLETARGSPSKRLRIAARLYVDFALGYQAYFRLMFRPELTDFNEYPEVARAGGEAYGVLARLVESQFAGRRVSRERLDALVTMHWAMVHGVATLILDGSLRKRCPTARALHAHIETTLDLFTQAAASLEP